MFFLVHGDAWCRDWEVTQTALADVSAPQSARPWKLTDIRPNPWVRLMSAAANDSSPTCQWNPADFFLEFFFHEFNYCWCSTMCHGCHDIQNLRRSGEAATKMQLSAVCAQGTQLFQLLRSVSFSNRRSPVPFKEKAWMIWKIGVEWNGYAWSCILSCKSRRRGFTPDSKGILKWDFCEVVSPNLPTQPFGCWFRSMRCSGSKCRTAWLPNGKTSDWAQSLAPIWETVVCQFAIGSFKAVILDAFWPSLSEKLGRPSTETALASSCGNNDASLVSFSTPQCPRCPRYPI